MTMKVLYFAHLKSAAGCGEEEFVPGGELDTDGLWAALLARHPGLAGWRGTVRLARNGEYAGADARYRDGDEVALIPPVSGG